MGIIRFRLVLVLPSRLGLTSGIPADLDYKVWLSFELLDLAVHDFDRFLCEVQLFIDLGFSERNRKCFIRKALLMNGDVIDDTEVIVLVEMERTYATKPNPIEDSKWSDVSRIKVSRMISGSARPLSWRLATR